MYVLISQEGASKEKLLRPTQREWESIPQVEALAIYHNLMRKGASQIVNLTLEDLHRMKAEGCFNLPDRKLDSLESQTTFTHAQLVSPQSGHKGFDSPTLKLLFTPEVKGGMPMEQIVFMEGIGIDVVKLADFMCPWTKQS